MAKHYYGVNLGAGTPSDVTVSTSTNNSSVELVITDGVPYSKTDVVKMIEVLEDYIVTHDAPV